MKKTKPRYVVGLSLEEWRGKTTIYDRNRDGFIFKSRSRGAPIARAYTQRGARLIARALNNAKGTP